MNEAVRTTLTDIGRYFRATQTPFAIIGGIAVVARGEPRFTGDIDVVAGIDLDRALTLLDGLEGSPFRPLLSDARDVVRAALILPLRHRTTGIKVDVAVGLSGFERDLIARATDVDFGACMVPVATAEDLLLMKVLAGRPRDQEDAVGIVERQGPGIDWEYVMRTGRDLQEALGQDFLPQLERLRRASTSGPGEGDLPRGR
ncbi:MAG: nucleotidyl transferase AbiEii/AbiGii toxin family protein [Planctomycetes bacterium]|nr:nucleotidyl transferase AbiEii/AbiGii toxin family protein [Planctomycetota bacterium]